MVQMKYLTFGEIMLRLKSLARVPVSKWTLEATFGGGEANVAVSLANYGLDSVYVTKLPSHAIGQAAVNALRSFGVDTSHIVRGGDRVGIYFLEKGPPERGRLCIYDRATPPSRRPSLPTLTGTQFLPGRTGSTLPASRPLWAPMWWRSARTPAGQPRPGSQDLLRSELPGKLWTGSRPGRPLE